MTVATVDRPVRATEMGVTEAKEITQAIKNNFDSLGAMILQSRDRKAYKALGYRAFETYCKTEFGKSVSQAYQLIEDVKAVAELETEISKQYDEPVTLRIPSSHLRPLKHLPEMGDKLKAIEYAKKLATAEGKTPTKKHVEIAVFEVSGKRSGNFKSAIEGQGFTKGVQVEVTKSLRKDRGFVAKVDKLGKIYVELHNGGAVPISYDLNDLRILGDTEKPAIPASDHTAEKGDKVKIFAKGLEGIGEIYTWKMGKHAMVKITGEQVPVNIAYAELELIQEKNIEAITVETTENIPTQWREDSNWTSGENHYYYFARENKIYNTSWPNNITITPNIHTKENPIEFMEDWIHRFAGNVAKSLVSDTEILENQRLREQLAEAESAIEAIVGMAREQIEILPEAELYFLPGGLPSEISAPGDTATHTDFLVGDAAEISAPGDTAQENWIDLLKSLKLSQQTKYMGVYVETYRDWDIRFLSHDIAIRVVDIVHAKKGCFSCHLDQVDDNLDNFDEIHAWTNNVINQIEDFRPSQLTPGDTAANTEFLVEDITSTASPLGAEQITEFLVEDAASTASPLEAEESAEFLVEASASNSVAEVVEADVFLLENTVYFQGLSAIEYLSEEAVETLNESQERTTKNLAIEKEKQAKTRDQDKRKRINKEIQHLETRQRNLEYFWKLRIGQEISRRIKPQIIGKISRFEVAMGGLPLVWVTWDRDNTLQEECLPVGTLLDPEP